MEVARLISGGFDLRISNGVDAGELQRAEKAADQKDRDHHGEWYAWA